MTPEIWAPIGTGVAVVAAVWRMLKHVEGSISELRSDVTAIGKSVATLEERTAWLAGMRQSKESPDNA